MLGKDKILEILYSIVRYILVIWQIKFLKSTQIRASVAEMLGAQFCVEGIGACDEMDRFFQTVNLITCHPGSPLNC